MMNGGIWKASDTAQPPRWRRLMLSGILVSIAIFALPSLASAQAVLRPELEYEYPVPRMQRDGWNYFAVKIKNPDTFPFSNVVAIKNDWRHTAYRIPVSVPPRQTVSRRAYIYRNANSYDHVTLEKQSQRWGNLGSTSRSDSVGRSVLGLTSTNGNIRSRSVNFEKILESYDRNYDNVAIAELADASDLPDLWMGYDLLQMMVLDDFPYDTLTNMQIDAIVQYVERGGTLLVSPGTLGLALKSDLLARLIDIKVEGSQTIDAPEYLTEYGVSGRVVKWNFTVENAGDHQWATVNYCGHGTVVVFRYDLLRQPIISAVNYNDMLVDTFHASAESAPRPAISPSFPQESKGRVPSSLSILFITSFYILLVAPVNYLLLRRRDKLILMPITIGIFAIITTAGIIGYAYMRHGTASEIREITVVETLANRLVAHATARTAFYSTSNRLYVLAYDSDVGIKPPGRDSWQSLHVTAGTDSLIRANVSARTWNPCVIETQRPISDFGSIYAIKVEDSFVVFNNTNVRMKECYIRHSCPTTPGRAFTINAGPLGPGEERVVPIESREVRLPPDLLKSAHARRFGVFGIAAENSTQPIPRVIEQGRGRQVQNDIYILGELL